MPSSYADFGGLIRKIIGVFTITGLLTVGSLASGGTATFNNVVVNGTCTGCGGAATYLDNAPLYLGTDHDSSVVYDTSGSPDVLKLGAPTSSNIIIIGSQDYINTDFINAAISAPQTSLIFTAGTSTNSLGIISQQDYPQAFLQINSEGGDDLNGTARNADGAGIFLTTSNGGSLGGHEGGELRIDLGSGTGGAPDGIIVMGDTNADFRFKNNGTGVFRVGDSSSEAALTFDHNGSFGVVSSTVGGVRFFPNVSIGNATGSFDARFSITDTQRTNSALPLGMFVDQTYVPSGAGNSMLGAVIRGQIGASSTLALNQVAGAEIIGTNNGTGPVTDLVGSVTDVHHNGSGFVTNEYGHWYRMFMDAGGSVDNLFGSFYASPFISGTGTALDVYGIWMDPMSGGTNSNYAFFYNNGANSAAITGSGGMVLGGTTTTNGVRLEVKGAVSSTQYIVNGTTLFPVYTGTSASIGGGLLGAGTCATTATSIPGATTSMVASVNPNTYPGDGSTWYAYVSGADTVTVKVCALVAITPTASTYRIRVLQ